MKKNIKKMGSLILMFAVCFTMAMTLNITAKADYFYKITIVIGGTGNERASFVDDMSDVLTIESINATVNKDATGNLVIENLAYNDKIVFNPQAAVAIQPDIKIDADGNQVPFSKYYVKGMRRSGANDVVTASSFNVTQDDSFVIAYGVGAVIPYTVKYVDGAGNALAEDAIFFAAKGDELYIPHKYINGYVPNAYNIHCPSLQENDEFVFTYSKSAVVSGNTVYENSSYTEYGTQQGPSNISYQHVPRALNVGTINNRPAADQAADGQAAEGDDAVDAATETIQDEEVPLVVEDLTEIEDEEVAKSAHKEDSLALLMRWAIILICIGIMTGVLISVIALVQNRKSDDE
jgi:hypothetical protein